MPRAPSGKKTGAARAGNNKSDAAEVMVSASAATAAAASASNAADDLGLPTSVFSSAEDHQPQRLSIVSKPELQLPWQSPPAAHSTTAQQQIPSHGDHFLGAAFVKQLASEIDPALSLDADACEEILKFVDGHLTRVVTSVVRSERRRARETEETARESERLKVAEQKLQLEMDQKKQQGNTAADTTTGGRKFSLNPSVRKQQQQQLAQQQQQAPRVPRFLEPVIVTADAIRREAAAALRRDG